MNEISLQIKRYDELNARAQCEEYFVFSDFLTLDEQNVLYSMNIKGVSLYGGYEGAQRCIASFGDFPYDREYPICIIEVYPLSLRFAKPLSHRDFLGSLMGLGIERKMIGDIVVFNNTGYVFGCKKMCDYIVKNLTRVGSTDVRCSICESLPDGAIKPPVISNINVASLRLDVTLSAVFQISRNDAQDMITHKMAFVNGRQIESAAKKIVPNDVVSLRHYGKFKYIQTLHTTKKDRLVLEVTVY